MKSPLKTMNKRQLFISAGILAAALCAIIVTVILINVKNSDSPPQASAEDQLILLEDVTDADVEISTFYIYGTHLHLEGTIKKKDCPGFIRMGLVLRNSNHNETQLALECIENDNEIYFRSSEYINSGICLDELKEGEYCILFKVVCGSSSFYTSAVSAKKFDAVEYYTITRNKKNNHIRIGFTDYRSTTGKISCLAMEIKPCTLPDNVYDIVIDAGHGGKDPGACYKTYKESDFTLQYAKDLKQSLEALGLKVKMTRTGNEKEDAMIPSAAYNDDGRVERACLSGAKYCFSIHFNSIDSSGVSSPDGFQIYCPYNCDTEFAKSIADNVKLTAKAKLSEQTFAKVAPGVYIRTFNDAAISASNKMAKEYGYKQYKEINKNTTFYYMIRETGGVATGAYVDGRSKEFNMNANESRSSLTGLESYLLEIGYICNESDLKSIIENRALYIEALTQAISKELKIKQ